MLRNSKIHKKLEDPLTNYKRWEFFIKNAGDLLSALGKFGLFLGILNVFLYILKIEFMPSGLSLSDSITFIFTFLAVSFISIVGIIYGFICTVWICFLLDGFINKRWWGERPKNFGPKNKLPRLVQSGGLAVLSFFMLLLMFTLLSSTETNDDTKLFFFSLAATGSLFSIVVLVKNDSEKNGVSRNVILVILALLTPYFISWVSNGEIFSISMKLIGIRHENIAIETTSENIKRVNSLSKMFGMSIATCPLTGSDNQLLPNANILWTGIGNRTLVEVVSQTFVEKDTHKKFLYVQFDNAAIWPVYAKKENDSQIRENHYLTHCSK